MNENVKLHIMLIHCPIKYYGQGLACYEIFEQTGESVLGMHLFGFLQVRTGGPMACIYSACC